MKKSLTVDEAINLLKHYKEKYSGEDELEIITSDNHLIGYSGLTVDNIEHENGPYCTIYASDNYNLYKS